MKRPADFATTLFIARIAEWSENNLFPKGYDSLMSMYVNVNLFKGKIFPAFSHLLSDEEAHYFKV